MPQRYLLRPGGSTKKSVSLRFRKISEAKVKTRQSSCVNARGIPPAAYQLLHLLSYSRGVPHPWSGYPPILTWWGCPPHSDLAGLPPAPGVNRQMPVKTVSSPILRMRAITRKSSYGKQQEAYHLRRNLSRGYPSPGWGEGEGTPVLAREGYPRPGR